MPVLNTSAPQNAGLNKKGSLVMKSLLMFFGYSAYQAGCIAPIMWFFVIGAVVVGVAEWKGWLN